MDQMVLKKLSKILDTEGILEEDQGLEACENVVTDVGFFSYRMWMGWPYLVHFWVDKKLRSPANFYKQVKQYKDLLRKKGFTHTIINAPESGYVTKFVEGYAKLKPYSRHHGQNYYFVGVNDHGKKQST